MEINLFQLLILLFIFYPLIKRVLNSMKTNPEAPEHAESADDPWEKRQSRELESARPQGSQRSASGEQEARGEQTWEDFFEGMERVLSGDEPERERTQTESTRDSAASRQQQATHQSAQTRRVRGSGTDSGSGYRHPSHEPIHSPARVESANPFSYEKESGTEIGAQADELSRELIEGDNPIYTTLDESPEVVVSDARGKKNVKAILMNPERLRDGILLKEILDPPKSRRPHHHNF